MNHLGGKWSEWIMLSGFPGFPRNKGTDVSPSEDAIRATKGHMGSVLTD